MRRVKYIYVLTIGILIYGCEAEIPARNVPYKLDIDIYPSYSGESLSPVIIFIHGGAWTGGYKAKKADGVLATTSVKNSDKKIEIGVKVVGDDYVAIVAKEIGRAHV